MLKTTRVSAAELLAESCALLDQPPSAVAGLWETAAILLARQALEEALERFWRSRSPELVFAPMHAQLLCLGTLMNSERDAADISQLWATLSNACHFGAAEAASAAEVETWVGKAKRLCELLELKAGFKKDSDYPVNLMPDGSD